MSNEAKNLFCVDVAGSSLVALYASRDAKHILSTSRMQACSKMDESSDIKLAILAVPSFSKGTAGFHKSAVSPYFWASDEEHTRALHENTICFEKFLVFVATVWSNYL